MERIDIYDREKNLLRTGHPRGQEVSAGEYMLLAAVWVVDGSKNILVTLRHPEKSLFPNYWENPGGFAQTGEGTLQAAVRELREETGLTAPPENFIWQSLEYNPDTIIDSYALVLPEVEPIVQLCVRENSAYRWVPLEELKIMLKEGQFAPPIAVNMRRFQKQYMDFYNKI